MKKSTMLALLAPALIAVLALFPYSKKETPFHSDAELEFFKANFNGKNIAHDPDFFLEIDSNILFPIAKTCGGCHGFDSLGFAFITYDGKEVNVYDDWRSTMMANSARDPFWRAKVTHEILVNPSHSLELQDKCTSAMLLQDIIRQNSKGNSHIIPWQTYIRIVWGWTGSPARPVMHSQIPCWDF
ncbi:MAG: hypothetical protein R2792_00415 [Saprospiraceae bacterium]